jgi:hypothetical protein
MNVAYSLKAELARQGVNAKGEKAGLKARLIDALERFVKALPEGMVKARGNILGGFAGTAYLSQLKPRMSPYVNPSTHSIGQGHQQQYLRTKQGKLLQNSTLVRHSWVVILVAPSAATSCIEMGRTRRMLLRSRSEN